jgi:hypothetical protein
MSALSDVQAAFATTLAQMNTYLDTTTALSVDTPIEVLKVAKAYSVTRAAVVAALPTSATAQADAAAGHVALDAVLDDVIALSVDTPIEQVKDASTAFKVVGATIAALT